MSTTTMIYLFEGAPHALGDSGVLFIYNLLPVGKFYDKRYGEVWISDEMIRQMESNFGKYPTYEVPVKFGHSDGAASPGKVIAIAAKPEGLEITFTADKDAAQDINNKRYRYMSAEFDPHYVDKKTGEEVGPVLTGVALVNQPADPYVQPLVLSDVFDKNREEKKSMDPKDIEKLKADLRRELSDDFKQREDKAKAAFDDELKKQKELADSQATRIAELEAQNKTATDEQARLQREKYEADIKAFCETYKEKACPDAMSYLKTVLLAENRVIKLSETQEQPLIKFLSDFLDKMPKFPMEQSGSSEATKTLSDVAIEKAKRMAAAVERGKK